MRREWFLLVISQHIQRTLVRVICSLELLVAAAGDLVTDAISVGWSGSPIRQIAETADSVIPARIRSPQHGCVRSRGVTNRPRRLASCCRAQRERRGRCFPFCWGMLARVCCIAVGQHIHSAMPSRDRVPDTSYELLIAQPRPVPVPGIPHSTAYQSCSHKHSLSQTRTHPAVSVPHMLPYPTRASRNTMPTCQPSPLPQGRLQAAAGRNNTLVLRGLQNHGAAG